MGRQKGHHSPARQDWGPARFRSGRRECRKCGWDEGAAAVQLRRLEDQQSDDVIWTVRPNRGRALTRFFHVTSIAFVQSTWFERSKQLRLRVQRPVFFANGRGIV